MVVRAAADRAARDRADLWYRSPSWVFSPRGSFMRTTGLGAPGFTSPISGGTTTVSRCMCRRSRTRLPGPSLSLTVISGLAVVAGAFTRAGVAAVRRVARLSGPGRSLGGVHGQQAGRRLGGRARVHTGGGPIFFRRLAGGAATCRHARTHAGERRLRSLLSARLGHHVHLEWPGEAAGRLAHAPRRHLQQPARLVSDRGVVLDGHPRAGVGLDRVSVAGVGPRGRCAALVRIADYARCRRCSSCSACTP